MKESGQALVQAAESIESFRRSVNEAFSRAPEGIDFDFSSTLDQLADYQYKLSQAWRKLILENDASAALADANRTVEESQRVTLLAWRAFVETKQKQAEPLEHELGRIQADVSELSELKQECDRNFQNAIALHEKNESSALEKLQKSEQEYSNFISKATAKIAGTRTITKRERRRQRLGYSSAISGVLAIFIALIGRENIFRFLKWAWGFLSGKVNP